MSLHMVELTITYVCAGQLAQNVTHWKGDVTEVNLFRIANNLAGGFVDGSAPNLCAEGIKAVISEDAFISSVKAQVLKPNPGPAAYKVFASDRFPGDRAADIYAQSVAAVMRLFTPSGSDYTGRAFIPGIAAEDIIEGRFTVDFQAAFLTLANQWVTGIASDDGDFTAVVVRRPALTWEDVINTILAINPGTIRRRLIPV